MKKNTGYTLLELMVAIAVIAVLSGISVPAVNSLKKRHAFGGALQDVLLTLRQARLVAVEENETVVVAVNVASGSSNGSYRAFVDDGGGDTVDSDLNGVPDKAKNGDWENGERIVIQGSIPDGVRITGADFSKSAKFRYDNRGFPTDAGGVLTDGAITLESDLGGSRQISLLRSGHSVIQ